VRVCEQLADGCYQTAKRPEVEPATADSQVQRPGAQFTKYLTTILRLSYDNAKVTIDLRRTSNLQNILRRVQGFS